MKKLLSFLALALAFIFSCSSNEDSKDDGDHSHGTIAGTSSSSGNGSSSSGGGNSSNGNGSSSSEQSSSSLKGCEDIVFNPDNRFCYDGETYEFCDGMLYNPTTHICQGTAANPAKCNNAPYNPLKQDCCVSSAIFNLANQICEDDVVKERCGSNYYNPATQFCYGDDVVDKCGGVTEYNPTMQFCHTDGKVYSKCSNQLYNPSTQYCHTDGKTYSCGSLPLNPSTQFCYNSSKVGNFCGSNLQKSYNPDLYECKPSINPNGIFLKTPVYHEYSREYYEAVLIGSQVWLARNLSYFASASKCRTIYGELSCDTYGRLYNWSTAMDLSNCNSSTCSGQIKAKHRGVCPRDWHIPSDEEWTTLAKYAGGTGTYGETGVGGNRLKATSGWNSYIGIVNLDSYGFSALPGGYDDGSNFSGAGYYGYWWSSSENNSYDAYYRQINYGYSYVSRISNQKSRFYSVRCVMD
jgi:uncharacterized protein (TIGR02145 family)